MAVWERANGHAAAGGRSGCERSPAALAFLLTQNLRQERREEEARQQWEVEEELEDLAEEMTLLSIRRRTPAQEVRFLAVTRRRVELAS